MEARNLRRLLRNKFPRKANDKAYEWEVNDPQLDLILQATAERKNRKVSYDASDPKITKTDIMQKGGGANDDSAANA